MSTIWVTSERIHAMWFSQSKRLEPLHSIGIMKENLDALSTYRGLGGLVFVQLL